MCAASLERLSALIEDASERGSFGLAQSTAQGKALVRILVLATVTKGQTRCITTVPLGSPPGRRSPWEALLARVGRRRMLLLEIQACERRVHSQTQSRFENTRQGGARGETRARPANRTHHGAAAVVGAARRRGEAAR
jgi:hypothetical protein